MTIQILDEQQILKNIKSQKNPYFNDYYAFYSSWFGGIVKDPSMMLLPIDDHMVHRGDGVFEAMKAVAKSVYLMDEHLRRLFKSAEKIGLKSTFDFSQVKEIILETLRAVNQNDAMIRVFLSRGPGNFSVNPYDSVGSQLYVVVTKLNSLSLEKYKNGVVIGKSDIPVKDSWIAQIKSCNYLPNVLMKKEAVDRHLDFVICIDEQNHITESATENIMIVDQHEMIIHPTLDYILQGTTMIRACELARENGITTLVRPISINDLLNAREVMITGTTVNVLPVVKFEQDTIGNGKPGPITMKLNELIHNDMKTGGHRTTF